MRAPRHPLGTWVCRAARGFPVPPVSGQGAIVDPGGAGFPVGAARKSGFLFPSFGNSDKSGFEVGVPYYFNLAPNYDLTLTPFLMSRRGLGLGADFRYLTGRSRGRIDNDYLPGDDLAGIDRRLTTLVHRTDFSHVLRVDANSSDASDSSYFEDFGLGPDGTSITFLDRNMRLAWLGRRWRLDGVVQDFQVIDRDVAELDRPYSRLPQLAFTGLWPMPARHRSNSITASCALVPTNMPITSATMPKRSASSGAVQMRPRL